MAAPQKGPSHRDGVSPARAEPEGHFASWCEGAGAAQPALSGATQKKGQQPFSPARADPPCLLEIPLLGGTRS